MSGGPDAGIHEACWLKQRLKGQAALCRTRGEAGRVLLAVRGYAASAAA